MSPTDCEIDKLIDEMNDKITYLRTVRDDAILNIEKLMKARRDVVEHYNKEEVI